MKYFVSYSFACNSVLLFNNCVINTLDKILDIEDIQKIEKYIWNNLCEDYPNENIPLKTVVIMNFKLLEE